MKGIDISSYQGNIDFNQVKNSGIEIVIIKASEGMTWKDPKFSEYCNGAKAAGLKVGAYHFLRANESQDEVNNFLDVIGNRQLDCKFVIDAEVDFGGSDLNSLKVRQFADILKSKGFEVCLYTGEYFYNHNLNDSVKDLPLWVAKYGSIKPSVGKDYIGWQCSESGNVSGIQGNVDINEFSDGILISQPEDPVKKIIDAQHALNRLHIKGKNGSWLLEDGVKATQTEFAINTFKGLMGLPQDGNIDELFWAAINEILSKPEDSDPAPHYEYATRFIRWRIGFTVSGLYDKHVEEGVRIWQTNHGLTPNGVFSNNEWSKLID